MTFQREAWLISFRPVWIEMWQKRCRVGGCWELGEGLDQHILTCHCPYLWFSTKLEENPQFLVFLWGGRVWMCVQCFSFLSSCLKESFRFCLSQGTNRTQYTPDIWGSLKTKKAGWLAAALRTHGAADRGQQKEKGACIPNSCFPRSCTRD